MADSKVFFEAEFPFPEPGDGDARLVLEVPEGKQSDYFGAETLEILLKIMAGCLVISLESKELGPVALQIIDKKLREAVGEINLLAKEAWDGEEGAGENAN